MAPGVATLTPEAAMPEQGHELLRGLKGLSIIGIDINIVTPLHDTDGATAIVEISLLAVTLVTLS